MQEAQMYEKIRLKPEYIDCIITTFKTHFSENDHLWIFGSRVNLQARGGDIDLYVETPATNTDLIIQQKTKFISSIWKQIGEQKIDVVINLTKDNINLPIYNEAINNGIKLV